jgi:glycosyltransferase involved in cell wall biosynthesis
MRFHVLGVPHTVTNTDYLTCAFTQKVLKFGEMMTPRGHEVIHYGHEDSNLTCTEHVTVIGNTDLQKAYGSYDWRREFYRYDMSDSAYKTFYVNAIREIAKRKQPGDFLLPFWGQGVKPICDAHPDMIVVEPGIGYAAGHFARWKIFESYAVLHAYMGLNSVARCRPDWYATVIPNYFDPRDFTYKAKKQAYFLFMGRVYEGKGVEIAIEVTKEIGAPLIIAGQCPDGRQFPDHVRFVGSANKAQRRELMANARAAFCPSLYLEPFAGVSIEMLLSGTPIITTDWGSFTENNINGVTGYRCRTHRQFVDAARNIDKIKPKACRQFAEQFLLENIAPRYEQYFQSVTDVYTGKGWYA